MNFIRLEGSSCEIVSLRSTLSHKRTTASRCSAKLFRFATQLHRTTGSKTILFWLVVRFDHSWLKYINNNNKEIFSYIKKNSDLYNLTINFKKSHNELEEVINEIALYDIKINGDNAKMYVHEKLVRHLDKTPITKSYNWLYKAKRIDGIWYLTEMKKTHKTFHE